MARKSPLLRLTGAALLALAAVSAPAAEWTGAQQRQGAAAPVTWTELQGSHWLADGRDDAPRKVYVFMDANCPYCTKFWSDARPWVASGKVQLRHIMVAVLSPSSAGKAATLLADPDPAKRLASYEQAHAFGVARMMAGGPPHALEDPNLPTQASIPEATGRLLVEHDLLLRRLNLMGTPGLVFQGPDGRMVARVGVPPGELESVLGPR
jgi:thiol:disulfide interchange protein DsbG